MRIDHLRCPGTAGIYAIIVTDPTIRNGSNRYLPPEVDMAVSDRSDASQGVHGILGRRALTFRAQPRVAGAAYSRRSRHWSVVSRRRPGPPTPRCLRRPSPPAASYNFL